MDTQINDEVEVLAHFKHSRLIPLRFLWKNHSYRIQSITTEYRTRDGGNYFTHYAAVSNDNLYELVYNPQNHHWQLTQVQTNA